MTVRILSVDPGLTVGYATYDGVDGDYQINAFQEGKWDFLDWANPYTWQRWFDIVICERFTITPQTLKMSRQPHPIEVIGVLRWWCEDTETTFVEQGPAEAKGFVTNDRLKALGIYRPGKDHANDALRHLVLYLVKEGAISVGELVREQA